MNNDEIIRIKEEAYQRGFQDGFRQGSAYRPIPTKDIIPKSPKVTWDTHCSICGIDLSKAINYCCNNVNCPGRVTC
jgi:hypothetical protein